MEGAGGIKRMWSVRSMRSASGRWCLHDRQNIALHAFAADIRAVPGFAACDLVDLIEKNDAALFDAVESEPGDLFHVHQFLLFFLNDVVGGLGDRHPALPALAFHHAGKEILHVELDFLQAGAFEKLQRPRAQWMLSNLQFDDALIELARAQLLAESLAYLLDAGHPCGCPSGSLRRGYFPRWPAADRAAALPHSVRLSLRFR